ncbi:MAG: hypothetical protein HN411_04085 [Waddliaceae bacterium]|jgi:hypothetical protein|nr:hypothetical protein [Waddliaceae bacterium]MBT3578790.1 hypothetical protein [Waddliaceae bacterium]MBT4444456.1 hypothetical protein [Waddliaceae bacterium]MBT6928607.1 hypothetical protein [Waddliaceae bacterium]MBT7264812.1 hypothetical protein [Waddliaceae bacterium]
MKEESVDTTTLEALLSSHHYNMQRDIANAFREERLGDIVEGATPLDIDVEAPKVVMHIVPFDTDGNCDLSSLYDDDGKRLTPLFATTHKALFVRHYNIHGILSSAAVSQQLSAISFVQQSYVQLFRNGSLESVNGEIINGKNKTIPIVAIEKGIIERLPMYLSALHDLGINTACYVMISVLGVKDFSLAVSSEKVSWDDSREIDHDNLILPHAIVDTTYGEEDVKEALKPAFDALWNSAGYPGSVTSDHRSMINNN